VAWCDGQQIMSDILQFVAHWSLIAVLTFFFIGTVAYLMGLIVVPRKWKVAALVLLALLGLLTVVGAILGSEGP
jgi:hypothetical protein